MVIDIPTADSEFPRELLSRAQYGVRLGSRKLGNDQVSKLHELIIREPHGAAQPGRSHEARLSAGLRLLPGATPGASVPWRPTTSPSMFLKCLIQSLSHIRAFAKLLYKRRDKVKGVAKVSSKNQVTLPVEAMRAAGLRAGDDVVVRPIGEGEVVVAVRGSRVRRHAGIATGIYPAGELNRLREEWER